MKSDPSAVVNLKKEFDTSSNVEYEEKKTIRNRQLLNFDVLLMSEPKVLKTKQENPPFLVVMFYKYELASCESENIALHFHHIFTEILTDVKNQKPHLAQHVTAPPIGKKRQRVGKKSLE